MVHPFGSYCTNFLYLTLYTMWILSVCGCIVQYVFIKLSDRNVLPSLLDYGSSKKLKTALF